MALSPATHLGPYEVVGLLGAGGMGEVYRARDPRLDRDVAIKVLPEDVAHDRDRLRRFEKEARAVGALNHPNILAVHDVGTHDGRPYLVTELLEGDTLRERLGRTPLPAERAIDYAVQIARGLAAAHDKGIVHRDIKPENLFVTKDGLIKILDFGLAKLRGPQGQPRGNGDDEETASRTTDTGAVIGTAGYMSPEQVRGRAVDHRSDIFSFGAVLYEMLSGRRAFRGDSGVEVLNAILKEEPQEVDEAGRGIPPQLMRILKRCLEKRPEDRFQSARDLVFDLGAVWGNEAPAQKRRRSVLAAVAAVAVLAVPIGIAWLASESEAPPEQVAPVERKMIVVLPFENLGPPEDAFFAAGTTEEVTNRLARVGGLGVISRTSAVQYDRTGKNIKQIGADLGVDFVLAGTVRRDPHARGVDRVRISPQLIRVNDDTHLWAESYDRIVDDIFAVQSEIATEVVGQLGVALQLNEQRALAERPTENLDAYLAYLRGLEYYWDSDSKVQERAVGMFEKAIGHDPTFVAAHGLLSQTHSMLYWYWYDRRAEHREAALDAALRALELDPGSPEAHRALGYYHYWCRRDYERALEEWKKSAERLPNDSETVWGIGSVMRRQGRFDEAIAQFEKALQFDPGNAPFASELADTYRVVRRYREADRVFILSISLAPNQAIAYARRALSSLSWNGALERAQAALAGASENDQPGHLGARVTLALYRRDYQTALDYLASGPAIMGETERELHPRELLQAEVYELLGRAGDARASYQAALAVLEALSEEDQGDYRVLSSLARANAGLGRKAEAIANAQAAVRRLPVSKDAYDGLLAVWTLAAVHAVVGEHDAAVDRLEYLLSIPSWWSVWDLRLDPRWDPLRDHPRFKKLVGREGQAGVEGEAAP